jgi:hypothetical protein
MKTIPATSGFVNVGDVGSPKLSKENSGKSPQHLYSPAILDFLEDDTIFMQANEESKRGKSKTEFVKTRDRQESEDS